MVIKKCVRKIIVGMMELLILLAIAVQANKPTSSSFCPSLVCTPIPHFSKLDKVQGPLINYLTVLKIELKNVVLG